MKNWTSSIVGVFLRVAATLTATAAPVFAEPISVPVASDTRAMGVTLVFASPAWSKPEMNLQNWQQFYPNAQTFPLPVNVNAAKNQVAIDIRNIMADSSVIDRIIFPAHGYEVGSRDSWHASVANAPPDFFIGGEKKLLPLDHSTISAIDLLKSILAIEKKIGGKVKEIVFPVCDLFANASDDFLNQISELAMATGADIIAPANVAYGLVVEGKAKHDIPTVGRYFKVSGKSGRFTVYDTFRHDPHPYPELYRGMNGLELGDQASARMGNDYLLIQQRVEVDSKNCLSHPKANDCRDVMREYRALMDYDYARKELIFLNYQNPSLRGKIERNLAKVVRKTSRHFDAIYQPSALITVVANTGINSQEQESAIDAALNWVNKGSQLLGDDWLPEEGHYDESVPFDAQGYIHDLAEASGNPSRVYKKAAALLEKIQGQPNPNQIGMLGAWLDDKTAKKIALRGTPNGGLVERAINALGESDLSDRQRNKFFDSILSVTSTKDTAQQSLLELSDVMRSGLLNVMAKSGGLISGIHQAHPADLAVRLLGTTDPQQILTYAEKINFDTVEGFYYKASVTVIAYQNAPSKSSAKTTALQAIDNLLSKKNDYNFQWLRKKYAGELLAFYTGNTKDPICDIARSTLQEVDKATAPSDRSELQPTVLPQNRFVGLHF